MRFCFVPVGGDRTLLAFPVCAEDNFPALAQVFILDGCVKQCHCIPLSLQLGGVLDVGQDGIGGQRLVARFLKGGSDVIQGLVVLSLGVAGSVRSFGQDKLLGCVLPFHVLQRFKRSKELRLRHGVKGVGSGYPGKEVVKTLGFCGNVLLNGGVQHILGGVFLLTGITSFGGQDGIQCGSLPLGVDLRHCILDILNGECLQAGQSIILAVGVDVLGNFRSQLVAGDVAYGVYQLFGFINRLDFLVRRWQGQHLGGVCTQLSTGDFALFLGFRFFGGKLVKLCFTFCVKNSLLFLLLQGLVFFSCAGSASGTGNGTNRPANQSCAVGCFAIFFQRIRGCQRQTSL